MTSAYNVKDMRSRGVVKLKDKDMFSVWVKTACCNMTSRQLRGLADITEKFARGSLLFTTRQIPIIPFVKLEDVEKLQEELKKVYLSLDRCGPTVRNVNVCYDDKICPEAVTSPLSLGQKLDYFFNVPMPHKVKIGVAACKKDCIISRALTDIGFVGVEKNGRKGYDVYVGGRLGVNAFLGVKMAESLSESECVKLVRNYFDFLNTEGKGEERIADVINRLGVERVQAELKRNLHEAAPVEPTDCQTALKENETGKSVVRVRATCGEVNAQQLRKIADIAEKYGKGFVHFVVRGSPEIPCVDQENMEAIRAQLREVGLELLDGGVDNLQSCFGGYCTEGNANPQSLLKRIEKLNDGLASGNLNITVSASGCPNSCGIAHLNDIGFLGVVDAQVTRENCNGCRLCVPVCKRKAIKIENDVAVIDQERCEHCGQCITVCPFDAIVGTRRGFAALVGGKTGEDTRLGEVIAEFLTEDEAFRIAERCLKLLTENKKNAASLIDEVGIEKFKEMLVPAARSF
ncbi:MAG: 4Fe-4S binding protein [Chloroflexi bacterium]|nr:4Fe-4S binding protein [Chloroflexota bacterium]